MVVGWGNRGLGGGEVGLGGGDGEGWLFVYIYVYAERFGSLRVGVWVCDGVGCGGIGDYKCGCSCSFLPWGVGVEVEVEVEVLARLCDVSLGVWMGVRDDADEWVLRTGSWFMVVVERGDWFEAVKLCCDGVF